MGGLLIGLPLSSTDWSFLVMNLIEHTFSSNSIKLCYYRSTPATYANPQTLIFLHGFTDNGHCWTRLARNFADTHDIILLDQRGHGHSDPPPAQGFTTELLVSDAVNLIRHLALTTPPVVIGHSLGGHVTALLAFKHPELVCGIVLEDPPWFRLKPLKVNDQLLRNQRQRNSKLISLKQKTVEELRAFVKTWNPKWVDEDINAWAISKLELNKDAVITNGLLQVSIDWREIPHPIDVPTLLITSESGIITPKVAELAIGSMKAGESFCVKGAAHNIRRDQYGVIVRIITNFLQKIGFIDPSLN